jgi:hypothetical protein
LVFQFRTSEDWIPAAALALKTGSVSVYAPEGRVPVILVAATELATPALIAKSACGVGVMAWRGNTGQNGSFPLDRAATSSQTAELLNTGPKSRDTVKNPFVMKVAALVSVTPI